MRIFSGFSRDMFLYDIVCVCFVCLCMCLCVLFVRDDCVYVEFC